MMLGTHLTSLTADIDISALPEPTELAVPGFIILMIIEMIAGIKGAKARFEAKDTLTSLIMGLGSTVANALTAFLVFGFAYLIYDNLALFNLGSGPFVFILAFILDDLSYYWMHRYGHRMRWLWAAHVVHHSSQHYNLSTALRQSWTTSFTPWIAFKWPLFLIGIEPAIVFFVAGINLVYQFWIHTEAIDRMPGWFEAIMNTPSHHRVHHGNNPRYLDANYAGVFIIWDRMFGTFVAENPNEPVRYGLVRDLGTFNPLRVAFHEWYGILMDMLRSKGMRTKLKFLFMPPGWSPDGSRLTSEMIKHRWQEREKRLLQEKQSDE